MMKFLGIDYGDRYIGLALGETGSIAVPHSVITRDEQLWTNLAHLVQDESIAVIVVGWPVSMSGNENERTRATDLFIAELSEKIRVPIYREDERLSSAEAKGRGASGRVDASAAAVLLQSYLDKHGNA